jgi:hypothetical protein
LRLLHRRIHKAEKRRAFPSCPEHRVEARRVTAS